MKKSTLVFSVLFAFILLGCGEKETPIELGKELAEMKIAKTSGKADGKGSVTVYLTSEEPVKVTIVAKAMNEMNKEIGRTTAELNLAKDDGKEIAFKFDSNVDITKVSKYRVELKDKSGSR